MRMHNLFVSLVAILVVSGCTSMSAEDKPSEAATSAPKIDTTPVVDPLCDAPLQLIDGKANGTSFDEYVGTALQEGESASALIFANLPLNVGDEATKIVARVTGDGDFSIGIDDPRAEARETAWGPEYHGNSSFGSGEEWGMGVVFDEPGCWTLTFSRGAAAIANLSIPVHPNA